MQRPPRHPPVPGRWLLLLAAVALLTPARTAAQNVREEVKRPDPPKLTKPPKLITFVPAVYPPAAQQKGIQGTVKLNIDLDAKGKVSKVQVLDSPDPALSKAAEAAVRQFVFSPAEVDNKPSPIRVQYAYNFVLEVAFNPRLPEWMEDRPRGMPKTRAPVAGRVREQGTRLPVPGVAVAIPDLGKETQTDGKGQFSFDGVSPGKYRLFTTSAEHKRETTEVEVKKGEQALVTFYVARLAVNPYETVVRGKRRKTVVTRVTLRQKELTTVPGTFGDPVRVVENLPGVARIPYVGGALMIRGAPPNDSGVFLDGIRIPQIYHFLGGPSVLNPEFLDRIDYYPGNPDSRYGRLIAGVVDVSTRNTFTKQWGGAADINLLNTALFLKAPLTDKISVAGAVRRSYVDAVLAAVLAASGEDATTVVPVYYDYQARMDVDLAGDDQLYVLFFGSDDQLAIASNDPEADTSLNLETQITFHRVLAGWRWQINDKLSSNFRPSFGIDHVNFGAGDISAKITTLSLNLRHDLELKLTKRVTLRFGLDGEWAREELEAEIPVLADYRNPGGGRNNTFSDSTEPVILKHWRTGIGAYVDAIVDLTDKLQVVPGVRGELYTYFGSERLALDPRLLVRYKLLPKTTLKAAAGLYSKSPDPNESNDTFGRPELHLEHAAHFSIGAEQQILPALSLDAQLYYIRRYGIAIPTKRLRYSAEGVEPLRFLNAGLGNSYGLEMILKHNVTRHFYGWLAYTLSRSNRQDEEDGEFERTPFDQTHILTLVGSFRLGVGWEVGARFRLVSGRPETPILGGVYDSDIGRYLQIQGESNSVERQLFHQLDFRVEKTWIFKLWRFSAYLDVQNVYNAENPEATLWDYRFKESGPLPGLPILPSLGLKGSF
jgi:TonB family protein